MHENESLFLRTLSVADTYPDSLLRQDQSRAGLQACRDYYAAGRGRLFHHEARLSSSKLKLSQPLVIIDFGEDDFAAAAAAAAADAEKNDCEGVRKNARLHVIRDLGGLQRKLLWPRPYEAAAGEGRIVRDPVLRVILLERLSPTSLLLNLGVEVLRTILTYHQVPAYFLNFLVSGGESWCFASSMGVSGFRGSSSSSISTNATPVTHRGGGGGGGGCDPGIASLGRSGRHVQLCLTLFSIRRYPAHALPRDLDPARAPRWETHSAVAYLHFDVVEGTAVWLLASPRCYHAEKGQGTHNLLWDTLRKGLQGDLNALSSSLDVPGRFRITLECLLAVAEWAIGELSPHIQDTEMRLFELTKPYLHPYGEDMLEGEPQESMHAQDLRRMAFLMEQRHESVMRVDNNLRVLRRLKSFISDEVSVVLASLSPDHADHMQAHAREFGSKLSSVIDEMEDLIHRAQALDKLAKNREEYIQRMQTHHSSQQMKTIAELTADDSSAMKQLSYIALILLPVTVVSTVLGTDIVKFQDLSNDEEKASGGNSPDQSVPLYSFSAAAFGTWAVASVVMTVVTLVIVKPLRRSGSGSGSVAGGKGLIKKADGKKRGMVMMTGDSLKKRIPYPFYGCNNRDILDSAEQGMAAPEPTSPAARSICTAPTVGKTASGSRETPVVEEEEAISLQAQALLSMGRWLGGSWRSVLPGRWSNRRGELPR